MELSEVDHNIRLCHRIFGDSEFRFGLCPATNLPYLLSAPLDIPLQSRFVCIFGDPLTKDLLAAKQILEEFEQSPPAMIDVNQPQALALETMAHFFRCSGCMEADAERRKAHFEHAALLYNRVLQSCCHSSVNAMLSDSRIKTKFSIVTPVPELGAISPDGRRRMAHCFAGLALCALFNERAPIYFCSLASAALAWDCRRDLELVGMLRVMLLLFCKHNTPSLPVPPNASAHDVVQLLRTEAPEMVLICQALDGMNTKLVLPLVLKSANRALLEAERALTGDADWDDAIKLAKAMNRRATERTDGTIPHPKGSIGYTHLVHGQIVERRCVCGVWEAQADTRFARCAACKATYYCSKQCQAADWKRHKPVCCKK